MASPVCARSPGLRTPRTARMRREPKRMSEDGSTEEQQAIRSTGTGSRRQTSFAAGMILEELCNVENHALDDKVAARFCPVQRPEEGVVAPRSTVTSRARMTGGGVGLRIVLSRISPPLSPPAARWVAKCRCAVRVARPVLRNLFHRHRWRLVLAPLLCDRCQNIRGQAGRRGHGSALTC